MKPPPELFQQSISYDDRSADIPIGVIVPFDFGIDWQYWQYLPTSVSLHFTRTPYLRKSVGIELARDVGRPTMVAKATRTLNALNPAVVAYACSSGSFVLGMAGEARIRQAMFDAGARAALTTSGAMIRALKAAGAHRIAVASPYTKRLAVRLVDFLEEAGFEALSNVHLGLATGIVDVSHATIAELVRRAYRDDADALFVSCTGLRTLGMVSELENEISCPIFTSNQVTLWESLLLAGALPAAPIEEVEGPILGDGAPMARSTRILLEVARTEIREAAG